MVTKPDSPIHYHQEIVRKIFRQKEEYHHAQARLPIEDKIRVLVELQKMALKLRPKQGKDDRRVIWDIH
jgi:hypothetical protein